MFREPVEGSQGSDLVYENIGDVRSASTCTATTAQEGLQVQPDPTAIPPESKDGGPATKESGDESRKNDYENVIPKQPSRPAPPKPLPYKLSKKLSDAAGDCDGKKSVEKVEKPTDVQSPVDIEQSDEPDALVVEQQYLQNWDPTPVLQELFGNVRPLPTPPLRTMDASVDKIRMAGYMEKQPVRCNQKRASVFKGWKKRHFKAVGGKLYYYEDHRVKEPLGYVNLVGCLSQLEGSRSVKLKCSSVKEAEDWREALEAESAVPVDSCHVSGESSATEGLTIIIDLGSSAIKAGFAQEDETRKTSRLQFPLRKSLKIDKLKFEILDLIGVFEHVFDKLKVDPSKHKDGYSGSYKSSYVDVIMTLPHGSGPQEKEELVELLLDHFQVEACYLQEQAVLAMYSYSAISGIVVDIGNHIDIFQLWKVNTPLFDIHLSLLKFLIYLVTIFQFINIGCMIEAGTTRLPYGGRQITDSFTRMLTEKGIRFFSEVETYISRAIKEKVSFVAKRGTQEDEDPDITMVVDLEKYAIPDGTRNVTVDTARHRCTEGLFKPSVWGKDNPGIHELTVKAIMACSIDIRKQMCRNIYLSGGGSMSTGLAERLQVEVSELMPFTSHVQVHAGLERHHAAYIGASVVAKLPLFEELCVFKEDWDETGTESLEKWLTL
ncbi:hypothetical protein OS493_027920 [Desmophyllum pertusum]|uniref:PH domain-containing protein n=1 Tax=Desmophyllum pertusum TaxID=174260 RepID=A0A9W9YKN8_9CNID|nr:hypothetical protein OS493_027920 [Desmophyllum pertusum]